MSYPPVVSDTDLHSIMQLGDMVGAPYYTIRRAAASGALDAEYHAGTSECDPARPCRLEPDTRGQHYVTTLAAAREWAANRRSPRRARPSLEQAFRAGWLAALDAVEQVYLASYVEAEVGADLSGWLPRGRQKIPVPEVYRPAGRVE